jgi:acetylornithine aminotransferase/acetylornithine/N-succinyldiaminopimelate aminotransferase
MHGTTFGGGPLVTAVAIAVIDTIRSTNLLAHVEEVGAYFRQQLLALQQRYPAITEVRGLGLMVGVEIESAPLATQIAREMMDQRIILNRTSETVLRFLPPFILQKEHVDTTIRALDQILHRIANPAVLAGAAPAGETTHGR